MLFRGLGPSHSSSHSRSQQSRDARDFVARVAVLLGLSVMVRRAADEAAFGHAAAEIHAEVVRTDKRDFYGKVAARPRVALASDGFGEAREIAASLLRR